MTRAIEDLDPALRGPVEAMLAEPLDLSDIPAARAAAKGPMVMGEAARSALARVESEERTLSGPGGSSAVRVRIARPKGRQGPLPALLWMHGGGYVFGTMDDDRPLCALMAIEGHCAVVAVEYRLAPEDPFPAALEDCYAALRWMASGAGGPGIDGARLAIGGASAGGGLAAGLALMARDREEIDVAFQLLVYPMLDDRTAAPAGEAHPDAVVWSRANNLAAWRAYLGCDPGGAEISCYAAPARGTDLRGLPPAYVAVGDLDLFVEEDITYALRLVGASVPVELHVYPGGCHAFDGIAPEVEISRRFTSDLLAALRTGFKMKPRPPSAR